jgi:hypothetical protein
MITGSVIEIFIDESVERIDSKAWKISICGVEIDQGSLDESLAELRRSIEADKIRFPDNGTKLHFSEMNDAQKTIVVEVLSKLPITAKIYTHYSISDDAKQAKLTVMQKAIEHISWLHRTQEISLKVEHADEYRGSPFADCLVKGDFGFILPDALLNVYCKQLNETGSRSSAANAQFYKLLKSKMRLQAFSMQEHTEYNIRQNRL